MLKCVEIRCELRHNRNISVNEAYYGLGCQLEQPKMPAEEKKSEDKSYAVRPHFRKKFKPLQVTEIIQTVLNEKLANQKYNVDKASKWTKEISETIKTKLKELNWDRYKYVVQVVIGEQRGEGIKMGTRCFWDAETDNFAKATFTSDSLFAVGVAFGVYLY